MKSTPSKPYLAEPSDESREAEWKDPEKASSAISIQGVLPECSSHKPFLEQAPCRALVTIRILGIFRLRRRLRSDCAQDDSGKC
jgi:hypothetical protein